MARLSAFVTPLLLACSVPAVWMSDVPAASAPAGRRPAPASFDNTHRIDTNLIDMFVTNHGSFAWDIATGNPGLVYPKGTQKTAVYAAGLWLGARVNDSTRVTTTEYAQEFGPGPMVDGSYLPDTPDFRTYEITRGDTSSVDYVSWKSGSALAQGAPLDSAGNPLLLGDEALWSVCNDANPAYHVNDAGGTAPLGVEVQLFTFAYSRSGALGSAVFLRWTLANKGTNTLDSAYVSMWMDADVGGGGDDLCGCQIDDNLGFMYNGAPYDAQYGSAAPAVGIDLLRGPIDALGDTLGMTSFVRYVNGSDPHSTAETYNYMRGLNADGTPVIDPTTSQATTYMVPGDPVAGTGWIDDNPADKRMVVSTGPFALAPGDQQEITVAVVIGQGADRLSSITLMKVYDDAVQAAFDGDILTSARGAGAEPHAVPLRLSVRSVAAGGGLRLSLTLPDAATPVLRLYDPTGACRWTRSYGSVTAGYHRFTVSPDALPAGLYVLEASALGRREVRRIVLLR